MQTPWLADEAFLADVTARAASNSLHLWWLGQSGFLLQSQGRHLLLDPYLSDSLTQKYAGTARPHERMTGRVVDPARLDFVDVVTSTHMHTDHLDAATLLPLRAASPGLALVIPEANRTDVAERLLCAAGWPLGCDDGVTVEVAGWQFTGVPAAHEHLETDATGQHKYLGYVVACAGGTIYHSGDTLRYPGLVERLQRWQIDVALLPINGRAPERGVAGNLDGVEAAELAHAIGAGVVIPCHYDMFAFNTATPEAFARRCHELGQPFAILRNGEGYSVAVG
jgi:L-ascorbate metabolism protein UlaG (beta-lactamase superfamily)